MAIDTETPTSGAIENEIASYRAVSSLAITSLLLGLASVLCFANMYFLVAGVGAIVAGALAIRGISRYSDVLTGKGIAQAGIGLALVCSLSSVTLELVTSTVRSMKGKSFAAQYAKVLKTDPVDMCVWYRLAPSGRRDVAPSKLAEQMKSPGPNGRTSYEMYSGPIVELKKRLDTAPDAHLDVDGIEVQGLDNLNPVVAVRMKLEGAKHVDDPNMPHDPKHEEAEKFALFVLKADTSAGKYEWWAEEIIYPYTPKSHVPTAAKPADDGHAGHGH